LTVSDSVGLTHSSFVDIVPRRSTLTLQTSIPGLTLLSDGVSLTTPASFQSVVGLSRTISAPLTQTVGQITYTFASWSDGGAATHQITTPASNTTYTATYQAQGLVGRWAFDDGAGAIVADSSGYGNDGTIVGGPAWTTGRIGGALSFAGTNYVSIENATVFLGRPAFTVAMWVNTSTPASTTLLSKRHDSAPFYSFNLRVDAQTNNRATCNIVNTAGASASAGGAVDSFVRGSWQHIACVYDGSSIRVYTNGVFSGYSGSLSGNVFSSNGPLLVPLSNSEFSGRLDEVRIYNRALSPSEVLNLYTNNGT
jgi:hypothetical protein